MQKDWGYCTATCGKTPFAQIKLQSPNGREVLSQVVSPLVLFDIVKVYKFCNPQ